jgi:hypothetical protein
MEPLQNAVTDQGTPVSSFRRPTQPRTIPAGGVPPISAPSPVARPSAHQASAASAQAFPHATGHGLVTAGAEQLQLEARRKRSALWFYWIAALSVINAAAAIAGEHRRFIVGLGITQVFTGIAARVGRGWTPVLIIDLLVIGSFVVLGTLALRGKLWAFGAGFAVYALDGLIFFLARDWVGLAFHVLVLFFIFKGIEAARRLKALRA